MLRFKVLASALPLAVAGFFAHGEFSGGPRPCIDINGSAVQIAAIPWQAQLHVGFTDDPRLATVRVRIVDDAENADFTVIDDIDDAETGGCASPSVPRLVAISPAPTGAGPVIFLSREGPADYSVFVRSRTFSAREAAALVVGAHGGHRPIAAASL